jgi:hypothetical protein
MSSQVPPFVDAVLFFLVLLRDRNRGGLMKTDVPRGLRGRILPVLTLEQVNARIALERAQTPVPISQDDFAQLLYDAVARDPLTPRALIFERMMRRYAIE